jgi:FixJ family two-component response regulator
MMNQAVLKVAVIDDDEPVRDSLQWLLDSHGFPTITFASAEAFLDYDGRAELGCLILDIRMPGMGGVELHDRLMIDGIQIPLIFITGHGDVPMAVERMKRGAVDFLEKPFSNDTLCALVAQCMSRAQASRQTAYQTQERAALLDKLTQRERQVLDLIVAGRMNKQIADDLAISIKTVEAHRASLMFKLNVRSMAELMKVALA